jgi:hypothetical protein
LSVSCGEETNILNGIKQREANSFGQMLRSKCILKHVIDGKIDGKRRKRRRERRKRRRNFSSYGMTLRKDEIL